MRKILWGVLCFMSLQAMAGDLFVMTHIPVAAEGKNALEARDTAMREGQKKAFEALLDKIVFSEKRAAVKVNLEEIPSFVQDISVKNERMGGTRYLGDLTVRFKAPLVRTFLQKQSVSFLSRLPQPMFVVPVFNTEGQTLVFDENNPLYLTLRDQMPQNNLFELTTIGVPQDKNTFSDVISLVPPVENLSYETLKPLLNRYHLTQALLIMVSKNGMAYELSTRVLPAGSAPEAEIALNVTDDREDLIKVMKDLSTDALRSMTKKWRYLSQNTESALTLFHVFTPVEKVSDLTRVQQKIKQMRFAERVDIKGFSHKRLAVDFYFRGSEADFAQKIHLSGMRLLYAVTDDPTEKRVYLLVEENSELAAQAEQGILGEDGKSYKEVENPLSTDVRGSRPQEKGAVSEWKTQLNNNQELLLPISNGSNSQSDVRNAVKPDHLAPLPENRIQPAAVVLPGGVPVNSAQTSSVIGTHAVKTEQPSPAQTSHLVPSGEEPGIFDKIQKSIWGFFSGSAPQKSAQSARPLRSDSTGQSIDITPYGMKTPVPAVGQNLDKPSQDVSSDVVRPNENILQPEINTLSIEGTNTPTQLKENIPGGGIDLTTPVVSPVPQRRETAETPNSQIVEQPAHMGPVIDRGHAQIEPIQFVEQVNGQKFSDISVPANAVAPVQNREENAERYSVNPGTNVVPLLPAQSFGRPAIVQ